MHREMNRDEFLFWKLLDGYSKSFRGVTSDGLSYVLLSDDALFPLGADLSVEVNRERIKSWFFDVVDGELLAERIDYWKEFNFDSYLAWLVHHRRLAHIAKED